MKRFSVSCALLLMAWTFSAVAQERTPPWPMPPTVGGGFGVQIKDGLADEAALDRIVSAGFSFVRFSIGWGSVERQKNVYDWRVVDGLIARVRAKKLRMIIPLLGGNAAYDGWVDAPLQNVDHVRQRPRAPSTPESIEAYARFAAQAALRYGSDDIVWEIWNEPDLSRFWPPSSDVQAFNVLVERACLTMRRLAPKGFIIGPGLGRVPDLMDRVTPAFWTGFLTSRAPACLNALSVHPYRHGSEVPEAVGRDYATLYTIMAVHQVYVPLVNSEWGYTNTSLSESGQADYVLRARLMDMIWGVPLSIWYEWRDSRVGVTDPEGHFGLLRYDGTDKPALIYLETILPLLRDAVLEREIPSDDPRDHLVLLRHADGEESLLGWSLRYGQEAKTAARFVTEDGDVRVVLSPRPSLLVHKAKIHDVTLVKGAANE